MRRIVLLALSLLVVPAAQAANVSWADPAGDAGGGPDVTQVRAATAGGVATFTILTTSAASWENSVAFIRIDAQPGGDAKFVDDTLTLHSNHDLITHEHWDGSTWGIVAPSQVTFTLAGSTLTVSLPLAELGSPAHFAFSVQTAGPSGGDAAPNSGSWLLETAPAPRFVPAQPVHGRAFSVTGATTCKATLGGKRLPGICRWAIPAKARGATLVVGADGRTYRFRVR
jgi:hypothetical protein